MSRGGARKGAGRPPGKTKAVGFFSLRLSTLRALEQSISSGKRSGFVDSAICAALESLRLSVPSPEPERASEPLYAPAMPIVQAPRPFEIV